MKRQFLFPLILLYHLNCCDFVHIGLKELTANSFPVICFCVENVYSYLDTKELS